MKLGIVVVYMVNEGHERLIDIHLDQIARHTTVPYTIHGSVNRLLPGCRRRLERDPRVKVYELAPTELRNSPEHSYYLEQLVAAAIEDGATHVVTLHVDSFPVRDGWSEVLAGRLSASRAFATIERINTACLLFPSAFHRTHRPTFLLDEEVTQTAEYRSYLRQTSPQIHSGVGYGFRAYQAGQGWYSMQVSASTTGACASSIHDDLLFHLDGAIRLLKPRPVLGALPRRVGSTRSFLRLLDTNKVMTSAPFRRGVRKLLGRRLRSWIDEPRKVRQQAAMSSEAERLLTDPVRYIEQLRVSGGGRPLGPSPPR